MDNASIQESESEQKIRAKPDTDEDAVVNEERTRAQVRTQWAPVCTQGPITGSFLTSKRHLQALDYATLELKPTSN